MAQTCKDCVFLKPDFDKNGRRYIRKGRVYRCAYSVRDVPVPTSLSRYYTYKPLSQQPRLPMPPMVGLTARYSRRDVGRMLSDLGSGE